MRFIGERDLGAAAKAVDGNRVLIRIGAHRFTAAPAECIELARQLVAAVDALKTSSTPERNTIAP
jgi:hypothetical protein